MIKAAIDIGTNSTRLLIMDTVSRKRILKRVAITRIGEGVDRGFLKDEAMERTLKVIKEYADEAKGYGCDPRAFGTSAVRDAKNKEEFLRLVKDATGVGIDVIDGDTEAELGFIGASALFPQDEIKLVVDIGGGSTEFIKGRGDILNKFSLGMGSVRFTERFIINDNMYGLYKEVENLLKPHLGDIKDAVRIIGIGGTITSLAAVSMELDEYDESKVQGYYLKTVDIKKIRHKFYEMSPDEMRRVKGLQRGREDIILAGTAILEKCLDLLKADGIYVSDWDNLEGYLLREEK
ncbi:MAG: Ppx/GppA phosphatase family protein [Thermoanaerobacteraceae bacterium]|nr:Ppx/GppA phosphatase family protein [Thermoanaerobacteraceae bacterium]